jgi:peptidoglycan/LPS O-acetylase OafA/YrhL
MMFFGVAGEAVLAFFVVVVFLLARTEPAIPGVFSRPFARALANCSYGFYMWHAVVGATLLSLMPKVLHLREAWTFPLAVAAIILTTLISIGSYRFFESPARRYLGSLRLPLTKVTSKHTISP